MDSASTYFWTWFGENGLILRYLYFIKNKFQINLKYFENWRKKLQKNYRKIDLKVSGKYVLYIYSDNSILFINWYTWPKSDQNSLKAPLNILNLLTLISIVTSMRCSATSNNINFTEVNKQAMRGSLDRVNWIPK